ncbi:EI24 domain-containing protein [Microbacterium aurantiacum]|uniref:EI24 domain-containing protein n=1 Tax=Microbacterium aurantiacum TaxID=162393 RepID=UPI000C802787|nr:EI24 domain-containing protein [Microbacterium aurantiacum]
MIREFGAGVRTLLRGFGLWRTRPGLMALGLIPAVIAFLLLAAALIPLLLSLGGITEWITPFAAGWTEPWRSILRGAVGIIVFIAALALAASVFSALALTIGDPFYERIWRAVETDLGGEPPADGGGFWTALGEGLRLVLLGLLIAVLVLLIGLIPIVGGVLGAVGGVVFTGRLLARELTGRAFDARNLTPLDRAALFAGSRARVLGFGVATQLCFLIPLGAVFAMPAAVAGSTMLARTMLDRATTLPSGPRPSASGPVSGPGIPSTGPA